jgi:SRSO17 transposase
VQGLFSARRANFSRMAQAVDAPLNHQQLHHFINNSPWDGQAVRNAIARYFCGIVKNKNINEGRVNLLIDESGFGKKGKKSAGVKRQYNGSRGKIDNCQVGVFGALNAGSLTTLYDARLYCAGRGKSKIDLAKEIVEHAVNELHLPLHYVCFDAFYGRDTSFLKFLDDKRLYFIADIPETLHIYPEPFRLRVPANKGNRGRKFTKKRPDKQSVSVKDYAASLKKADFTTIKVRHSSKGVLKARYHRRQVYLWDEKSGERLCFTLLIRKDNDGSVYYCLCRHPATATLQQLAYEESTRHFIERSFRDGKQELGMGQYQCRSEKAWNNHMTMCMLAMLFINEQKTDYAWQYNVYLSAANVKELMLAIFTASENTKHNVRQRLARKQPPNKFFAKNYINLRM